LDFLVLLIKNWPDDPTTRFDDKTSLAYLDVFGEVEEDVLDVIDFEFLDKVDDHLERNVSRIGKCIHNFAIVLFMMHMLSHI
jgi:hypothetical protein